MIIKLIRHGQSQANVGMVEPSQVGDHTVELTGLGEEQARMAGQELGKDFLLGALIYSSPFRRARETLANLLQGAEVATDAIRVFEDPRLREVEHGYHDVEAQKELRRTHGRFYYRFAGGESPADCYDRTSSFLEGFMRQASRKSAARAVIVTHGLTIRCFVMRFMHLTVEQFETISNPNNCDIVTIAPKASLESPQFESGRWGVVGLRMDSQA